MLHLNIIFYIAIFYFNKITNFSMITNISLTSYSCKWPNLCTRAYICIFYVAKGKNFCLFLYIDVSFTIYMHGRKFWWRLFYADLSCAEAPSTIEGPPLRFPIFFISSFFIIVNYCYFILISSCFVFSFLYLRF